MRQFVLVALVVSCTGCGTVVNLVDTGSEGKVYGGVRNDAALIQNVVDGDSLFSASSSPTDGSGAIFLTALLALPFLDLPLSFLGDTLTLPLTRYLDKR